MLTLAAPNDDRIAELFEAARVQACHAVIDGALDEPPPGWWRNCGSAVVGRGDVDFEIARQCLRMWSHFPKSWAEPISDGPTVPGQQIAVVARCIGFHVSNVCRVIDVVEHHSDDWSTFAITYSTCAGHDMRGAERFRLSWNKATDTVTFEVVSYSKPASLLARLSLPYVRSLQRRFAVESCDRVRAYVDAFRRQVTTELPESGQRGALAQG